MNEQKLIIAQSEAKSIQQQTVPFEEVAEDNSLALKLIKEAEAITINTAQDYSKCAEILMRIKSHEKSIDERYLKPLRESKRLIESVRKTLDELLMVSLVKMEFILKNKQLAWTKEQERKRQEEQRRLQVEADAKAERERQRKLKEAEKAVKPETKERKMQEAEEITAPVIAVQNEVPEIKGQSIRKNWKAKIVDPKAFVKAAIENETLWGFIEINQGALNRVASATKGQISYPGIEFYEEEILASGRR